jgi:hypothetical protein
MKLFVRRTPGKTMNPVGRAAETGTEKKSWIFGSVCKVRKSGVNAKRSRQ